MTSSNKNPEFERRRANTKISGVSPFQLFDHHFSGTINIKSTSNAGPQICTASTASQQNQPIFHNIVNTDPLLSNSQPPPPTDSLQLLLEADSYTLESPPIQQQKYGRELAQAAVKDRKAPKRGEL